MGPPLRSRVEPPWDLDLITLLYVRIIFFSIVTTMAKIAKQSNESREMNDASYSNILQFSIHAQS